MHRAARRPPVYHFFAANDDYRPARWSLAPYPDAVVARAAYRSRGVNRQRLQRPCCRQPVWTRNRKGFRTRVFYYSQRRTCGSRSYIAANNSGAPQRLLIVLFPFPTLPPSVLFPFPTAPSVSVEGIWLTESGSRFLDLKVLEIDFFFWKVYQ